MIKDIFRIALIPGRPITTRSESARRFDNCKEKSLSILTLSYETLLP